MSIKEIFGICGTALLLWGCPADSGNEETDNFDVSTILLNVADNIIEPQFSDLTNSASALESDLVVFNNTPNSTTLLALQNSFKAAYTNWQNCSFVNYGNTNLITLGASLNTYPTDTANIHSIYDETDPNLGSASYADAIGFPGLDYVLFNGTENEILDLITNKGQQYTLKNIQLIQTKSSDAFGFWSSDVDGFASAFKSDKSKSAGSAFSEFVNGYIKDAETLKNGQLGFPAGKFTLNTPKPEQAEALYSAYNIELFKAHLANLKRVYKGEDLLGVDGKGFDDYLSELGTKRDGQNLNELILNVFDTLEDKANLLTGNINEAIANQTTITDEIYVKTKELIAYLKVDMTNAFGVQITYIDNDGD